MTLPSRSMILGAQNATRRLADRATPFIFNEWYVAAFADELGRDLMQRRLLGVRIVMYRSLDGAPVALEDRCAHRSYPLSAGALDGDTVICAYHGFRYDAQGDCIEVPSAAKCPKGIGVRRYAMVERGPVVWIWMGDPALADAATIPDLAWMESAAWTTGKGYYDLKSSYVCLHENLLDTSHLSFIHSKTIGSPDYVRAPTRAESGDGRFALIRTMDPTRLPPIWGKPTGLDGVDTAARIVRNEHLSPALYEVTTRLYDGALPEGERAEFLIKAAHFVIPCSATETHYFIVLGRNFAHEDAVTSEFMANGFFKAFEEDVVALNLLESRLAEFDDTVYEISVPSDALGVAMRRHLKQRAEAEAAPVVAAVRVVPVDAIGLPAAFDRVSG